jgi:hypothetical protein
MNDKSVDIKVHVGCHLEKLTKFWDPKEIAGKKFKNLGAVTVERVTLVYPMPESTEEIELPLD